MESSGTEFRRQIGKPALHSYATEAGSFPAFVNNDTQPCFERKTSRGAFGEPKAKTPPTNSICINR